MFGWWNGKLETIVSWIVVLGIIVWLVWAGAIKPVLCPTPTHTQNGGTYYEIRQTFGCMRFPPINKEMK